MQDIKNRIQGGDFFKSAGSTPANAPKTQTNYSLLNQSIMKTISNEGKQELIGKIVDAINDGYLIGKEVSDSEIHNEVFNTDYFIVGRYAAERWLNDNYGVFPAIDRIKEYEESNFGEVTTELSEPERVCNMLVYIIGEELLQECSVISDNWDEELTEELAKELLEELEEL